MKFIKNRVAITRANYNAVSQYKCPTAGHVLVFAGSSLHRKKYNYEGETDKGIEKTKGAICQKSKRTTRTERAFAAGLLRDDTFDKLRIAEQGAFGSNLVRKRKKRTLYKISRTTKQRIKDKCGALFGAGRCRTFVTLSFIAPVRDQVGKRCLQNFIRSWRHKYGQNINYLWVAERQENGNVHFHILVSHRFDIEEENNRWVRVQYNAGLKGKSEAGIVYERSEINAAIRAGELKKLLNPFDVKPVYSRAGVQSYITKYITKPAVEKGKSDPKLKVELSKKFKDGFAFRPWNQSRRSARTATGIIAIPELFDVAMSAQNVRVQKKDYVDKTTGELKYPAGYVHKPVPFIGEWASRVNLLNHSIADYAFEKMNAYNVKILAEGAEPKAEYISELDYYTNYCRQVTEEITQLSGEKYIKKRYEETDIFYMDNGRIRCKSFDGVVPFPGVYHLRNGSIYTVGRRVDNSDNDYLQGIFRDKGLGFDNGTKEVIKNLNLNVWTQ